MISGARNIAVSEHREIAWNVDVDLEEKAEKEMANAMGCTIVSSHFSARKKDTSIGKLHHKTKFFPSGHKPCSL